MGLDGGKLAAVEWKAELTINLVEAQRVIL